MLAAGSVQLVVTSPPYPMVQMWDAVFSEMCPEVAAALEQQQGMAAFSAMHRQLDRVWAGCFQALSPGGLVCINIGDATRSLNGEFQLYPNHARIVQGLMDAGFSILPDILWRKPTNAPNKFMGSGMLPAGAYVTYEHEYILIARKGGRRRFTRAEDRSRRRRSAFFWEERNQWFSDLWSGVSGVRQALPGADARQRSAAFPVEVPLRLIWMYSLYEDTVLDPFAGTGTTAAAAVMAGRNSVGVECAPSLAALGMETLQQAVPLGAARARMRLADHRAFVAKRRDMSRPLRHHNTAHDVPVMTRQEVALTLCEPIAVQTADTTATAHHAWLAGDAAEQ